MKFETASFDLSFTYLLQFQQMKNKTVKAFILLLFSLNTRKDVRKLILRRLPKIAWSNGAITPTLSNPTFVLFLAVDNSVFFMPTNFRNVPRSSK